MRKAPTHVHSFLWVINPINNPDGLLYFISGNGKIMNLDEMAQHDYLTARWQESLAVSGEERNVNPVGLSSRIALNGKNARLWLGNVCRAPSRKQDVFEVLLKLFDNLTSWLQNVSVIFWKCLQSYHQGRIERIWIENWLEPVID